MFDMIRQAQAMKERLAEFKKELEAQSFTGVSGDGAVQVTVNGKHEVTSVTITPEAAKDPQGLEISVREAVNQAGEQVNAKLKTEVSRLTGGLGLPF
jgi:DNA-binding YbaB/EbfC family protein